MLRAELAQLRSVAQQQRTQIAQVASFAAALVLKAGLDEVFVSHAEVAAAREKGNHEFQPCVAREAKETTNGDEEEPKEIHGTRFRFVAHEDKPRVRLIR